ncbi:single-stranded DNA-binding protein [Bacillus sp. WMMC1349]|nr:single-stranded DNA-binding protein [Bacillus sp. WMMC1349]NPC90835.1 single-stranded DNA-binding protein [Bacillus sp. WMMC1349]NPC90859.1 single-stranded DNA-binding protein [Bacillus sp. WMMC1349]NPC90891.1 single-stranded DNA-binding protein [Bacillus sp. WMMC1349]NPC90910.1 single-stranded DNA-binding protein [Bacillus sp. WMMC1349]NPC90934.1 single-stranded DNA-binding protein [Bacillus sp. WMMC1349]
MNNVSLIGRLTRDPELKYTPSGNPVVNFTVAVNRTFTNQQGERQADFINCQAWKKLAENIANFQRKGSLIGVSGRLQTSSYEKDGTRVYKIEVVVETAEFLEPKKKQSGSSQSADRDFREPMGFVPGADDDEIPY